MTEIQGASEVGLEGVLITSGVHSIVEDWPAFWASQNMVTDSMLQVLR